MKKKEREEDRVERIIRSLLKLPENRRCINCNSLGPQYVCTTFLTFVCTNCSGVHREFTHRVKSVSMAKFKAEEVSALQAGGNERARQIYFKDWDPQRNSYPDGSNLHKLRDFIKHVYVDRKYSGERSTERLPRLRLSEKGESYESRKIGLYSGQLRSPSYKDRYENRERCRPGGRSDDISLKYSYDESRSPRYGLDDSRYGGLKKKPVQFEIVDDRFRDERTTGKQSYNRRFSHREARFGSLSPDRQKNMVRPAKESLGERPLQVGESSKATDKKDGDESTHNQAIKTSGSKGLNDGKEVEDNNQLSLIDFDSDPSPSSAVAAPEKGENQEPNLGVNYYKESSTKQNAQPAPKPNTLEFLLQELSVPSVEPAATVSEELNNDNSPTTSGGDMLTSDGLLMLTFHDNIEASINAPVGNVPMGVVSPVAPPVQMPATISSCSDVSAIASGDGISGATPAERTLSLLDALDSTTPPVTSMPLQPSNVTSLQQHQLTAFPPADGRPSGQRTSSTTSGGPNNQPWTSMCAPNAQGPCTSAEHSSQDTSNTFQDSTSGNKSQHFSLETKSIGRKELPVDLFAASYSQTPGSIAAWQNPTPPYGTGYNMQYYPNSVPARVYPNQSMSSNPFDINNETTSVQVPAFDVSAPGATVPISQIHANSSGFVASQPPSFASAMPQRSSSYGSITAYGPGPGQYMGQQERHMNAPPSRTQGSVGGFGTEDPFSSLNIVQQSSTAYQLPSARSLPSFGGNPFG